MRRFLPLILLLAACQPTPANNAAPTAIPFPTATIGRTIQGNLPIANSDSNLPNPATAVALGNQPTATPNWSACPPLTETALGPKPATGRAVLDEIVRYLSAGGTAVGLEAGLRDEWEMLGESGFVRADLDLTGEEVPEIIVGYTSPEETGNLLILACANGTFSSRYQAIGSTVNPPQILNTADLNFDQLPDILLSNQLCEGDVCSHQTQLVTWEPEFGRFASILSSTIDSDQPPEPRDIDDDDVLELVIRLEDDGNSTTGPLRTGVNIYDWNGALYVLSIVQLDPPRFKIQVVHEADRAFAQRDMEKAVTLYNTAFNDANLRAWFNDDPVVLQSYIAYRLLLSYAYTEDDRLFDHFQTILQTFPDPAARPIYATMSDTFWNALQVTNNLNSACVEVLDIVNQQPDALTLINRYGERSPTYSAQDLCPF
jgi:hypothetical protein